MIWYLQIDNNIKNNRIMMKNLVRLSFLFALALTLDKKRVGLKLDKEQVRQFFQTKVSEEDSKRIKDQVKRLKKQ